MNITKDSKELGYKTCAGRNCNNTALHFLTIVLIGQSGWFCSDCKKILQEKGLVESVANENEIIKGGNQ